MEIDEQTFNKMNSVTAINLTLVMCWHSLLIVAHNIWFSDHVA